MVTSRTIFFALTIAEPEGIPARGTPCSEVEDKLLERHPAATIKYLPGPGRFGSLAETPGFGRSRLITVDIFNTISSSTLHACTRQSGLQYSHSVHDPNAVV